MQFRLITLHEDTFISFMMRMLVRIKIVSKLLYEMLLLPLLGTHQSHVYSLTLSLPV